MKRFSLFFLGLLLSCLIVLLFVGSVSALDDSDDLVCSSSSSSVCSVETSSDEFYMASYVDEQIKTNMENSRDSVCIIYFYTDSCTHCAAVKLYLDELESSYGDKIVITRYSLGEPENIELYYRFCTSRDYEGRSVPVLGINDKIFVGEGVILGNLEDEIKRAFSMDKKICPLGSLACSSDSSDGLLSEGVNPAFAGISGLSFSKLAPVVVFAGLGDGINPCAFAVLIFVMAMLMQISGRRRKLITVVSVYMLSLLAVNVALGIIYFYTSVVIGAPVFIRYIVIVIAIIAGLINIKDFFFYGKGLSLKIPDKAHDFIQKFARRTTVFSAFILGSIVAVLEAPCSVPIYLTVIEILKGEGHSLVLVLPYILLYNVMFIVPLVVLAVLVYRGRDTAVLEKWRDSHKRWMRLLIGIILLALAYVMAIGIL